MSYAVFSSSTLLPGAVPTELASLLGKPTWHTATIQPTGDPSRYPGSIQVHLSHTATKANQVLQRFVRPFFLGGVGSRLTLQLFHSPAGGCGAGPRARPCRSSRARPAGKRRGQPQPRPVPIPRRQGGAAGPGGPSSPGRALPGCEDARNSRLAPSSAAQAGGRTGTEKPSPTPS